MLQEFRGHFLSSQKTHRDGERNRWLKPVCCVGFPDFARRAVVKSMNEIVQIPRGNLTALPSIKLCVSSARAFDVGGRVNPAQPSESRS